jgi:hypothetical protein
MKKVEKIHFLFLFLFVLAGIYLAHQAPATFDYYYGGGKTAVYKFTVLFFGIATIYHFYRVFILRPFCQNKFLVGPIVLGILSMLTAIETAFDFFPSLSFSIMHFAFVGITSIFLGIFITRYKRIAKLLGNWGVPTLKVPQIILFTLLIAIVGLSKFLQTPAIVGLLWSWMNLIIVTYPKNRTLFSRQSFHR